MEWNHTEAKYRTRRESLWGCECAGRRALLAQLPLPAATTVLPGHAQTVASVAGTRAAPSVRPSSPHTGAQLSEHKRGWRQRAYPCAQLGHVSS